LGLSSFFYFTPSYFFCQEKVVNGYRDSYHLHLTDFEKLIKIGGKPEFSVREHFNVHGKERVELTKFLQRYKIKISEVKFNV